MAKWITRGLLGLFVLALAVAAWFFGPHLRLFLWPETREKPVAQSMIAGGALPPGCVCHSKNQSMVAMHALFGIQDCAKCHNSNEDLTKTKETAMTPEHVRALEQRMKTERICGECHRSGKIVTKAKNKTSGRLYCPVDGKTYTKEEAVKQGDKYLCPRDKKTILVDIDKIAALSAKDPKNEYCIACHPVNDKLKANHNKRWSSSNVANPEKNCLKCHAAHSQCGGCHF